MAKSSKPDPQFEIEFFEAIYRRCPDYTEVVGLLGGLYTKVGRVADGLRMDRKLVKLEPDNATAHYNLACRYALLKQPDLALVTLRKAVELGYRDFRYMQEDHDLDSIRKDPRFRQLLREYMNR